MSPFSLLGNKTIRQYANFNLLLFLFFWFFLPGNGAAQAPTISSFNPVRGCSGTLVTITGTNLGNPSFFSIGGVAAIVVSNTGSSLVGMVMPGCLTGPISITTAGGSASSSGNFSPTPTPYPMVQQGAKLVGTGFSGIAQQGINLALSADGNTAIVGGNGDNNNVGAAWIYTRSGGNWTQQGGKLVGTGAVGASQQGTSVSLSADGNTAIVGGPGDNGNTGAVWIFTRSAGIWTQQGGKLSGSGAAGSANQGTSVSLSADGNTAIAGGPGDDFNAGAAWIFTRSSGSWSQSGEKLKGTGAIGAAFQGGAVALSADGNTAMVGGNMDDGFAGAAWVFSRFGNNWFQQGQKLVGSAALGSAQQGTSLALSADGNTAMIGGFSDNSGVGAAWVFTRFAGSWSQQGSKLLGSGASGASRQGVSVSLSADGNTAIVGGNEDNNFVGASWLFTRNGSSWIQQGGKLVGSGSAGEAQQGTSVSLSADGSTCLSGGFVDNGATGAAWVFSIQAPTINTFNPSSGCPGTLVTITGTNLGNPTSISIGGVPAIVVSNSGTNLVAMLMPGSVTGSVSISTAAGTATGTGSFTVLPTPYPTGQQGGKLSGSDMSGIAQFGNSISISADGNTAVVGGYEDNNKAGAAWIYVRNGGIWAQQGPKLLGTGAIGAAQQGLAVSISADGNTVMLGGPTDNSNFGAVWVFTRSAGVWSQQGNKLVGTGSAGPAYLGSSVSLSADGNTAMVGGPGDNYSNGAVWIFSRTSAGWVQSGSKLTGSDLFGAANFGTAVSLSADGNTALIGGPSDNSNSGAVWVFVQSGSNWLQQGNKLTGSGAVGSAQLGNSLALSADGNTALVGGNSDNSGAGAAWVFVRSGINWTQQGSKLLGRSAVGAARQGSSVALSADGNAAILGGFEDGNYVGAVWVFSRSGTSWIQQGNKFVGTGADGYSQQGSAVAISADGNTSFVGGFSDNFGKGSAWVYTILPPAISSFEPASGCPGTLVTVRGSNLGNLSSLTIGGIPAIIISNSGNSLLGMVMPGATSGPVSLTTVGGTVTSAGNFSVTTTPYPNFQQGNKLVGSLTVGAAQQAYAVSLSADGNTAIVGAYADNSNAGAAWIYSRSAGVWSPESGKLVGTGAVGAAQQGWAVALSADGNTALIGGRADNANTGAVWIFTRLAGIWTQQGSKLVGTGATGAAQQGTSVSLSADGNTAMVGGSADNTNAGAIWFFNRTGTVWSQTGSKLLGTGAVGAAQQGCSVGLSADGITAIVGGRGDNTNAGAFWIFSRASGSWIQQGLKQVGAGATGAAQQGTSVCISADGNTAMLGGPADNTSAGAAWIFVRTSGIWTQQGVKLTGSGSVGAAQRGSSVSLSADGNTAVIGGRGDNTNAGALWTFTRTSSIWSQQGAKLVGTGAVGAAQQGTSAALSSDGFTVISGGFADNSNSGAAWVFTLSNTITYNGNGNTGGTAPPASTGAIGTPVLLATNSGSLVKTGYSFGGWNTLPDGTGTAYATGASFTISGNVTLYAQWGLTPVITSFFPVMGCPGTLVTITGTNMGVPTNFTIGGVPALVISNTGTSLVGMVMPGASSGNITLSTAGGTATSSGNFLLTATPYPTDQQGGKLIGSGPVGNARQGWSVSVSADGNTAVVGGTFDDGNTGAVWFYTRSGGVWDQQGTKIVGSGIVGAAYFGYSVSLSADGNTALVGAYYDNNNAGAAWVFTRSAGVWTQQGTKLTGTGAVGAANFGSSVSLSADGNTALIGGSSDNNGIGASWIFTRTNGVWLQQGNKLVGTGAVGNARQGTAVSLSSDGNTALIGGNYDNTLVGAAWIFIRSGVSWTQQGGKLVGTGAVGMARQGTSVAISADGNTALIGADSDNNFFGAAWIFVRSAGTWSQQGNKLVGGATPNARVGTSVTLSADGNTAMLGGSDDYNLTGAAFIFTREGVTWTQRYPKIVGGGAYGSSGQGWSLALSADGSTAFLGGILDNSSNGAAWVFSNLPPSIYSFFPQRGSPGTLVTINGNNLNGLASISIGGKAAIVISNNGKTLVGMVMPGATTGPVSLTTLAGSVASTGNFSLIETPYPSVQQGSKLTGTGATANSQQGVSVAVSADGNTAIVGAPSDNSATGAAWIYIQNNGVWTQQGNKLVGTGAVGAAGQGISVAISADGNTVLIGASSDNTGTGAAWVFTRNGSGTWTQQGNKLVGTGSVGAAQQGISVSMSANGNVALLGGPNDNSQTGAVWVFTRSGSTWTQQGLKLVGSGAVGAAQRGNSVSISADGNTLIFGGKADNANAGAVWVFTRTNGAWTQEGNKLVGTGAIGASQQGTSVSLSADGNTVIFGGPADNSAAGAFWVFTRTNGIWNQEGNKLVGTGAVGAAQQGQAISLSADGNSALVGGWADNGNAGAAWVYKRTTGVWNQQGNKLVGSGASGAAPARQGWSVAISADGNTGLLPGYADNNVIGSTWVFTFGCTITYNGNGNTGGAVPANATGALGSTITLAANTGALVKAGFTFAGWNTLANGTGTAFAAGASYSVKENLTLYAQWILPPVISSFSPTSGCPGTLVTITGANLNILTSLSIGGAPAIVLSNNGVSLLAMLMPGAANGPVSLSTAGGVISSSGNFSVTETPYPNAQQGNKLVGSGDGNGFSNARQGISVSLSADGNTALVGGDLENSGRGAAWIFTRSNGNWIQQGTKLVGSGAVGSSHLGCSVSLSADGNTALIGALFDNGGVGATWVFIRENGSWVQQGGKLVGTGAVGLARQGASVSLSADGNTALIGGPGDNVTGPGAAWIFTRINGIWSQQGPRLFGTGVVGVSRQGTSVSLSADGNTALVGGSSDNSGIGAVWVFTRTSGIWTQQGNKLVGTGAVGNASQGSSVALSADGNIAMVGGPFDNSSIGAVWVFTRTSGIWTQQGSKLVGTGAVGNANQGNSVALSADGNTALIGGSYDNNGTGATWVFTRVAGIWTQQGSKLVGTGAVQNSGNPFNVSQGTSIAISTNGSTALVGGAYDNYIAGLSAGASWVFSILPPEITSFNPSGGCPGTLVTINGSNLSKLTAFSIGGVPAVVVSNNGTQLVGMVMPGAVSGPISVSSGSATASSTGNFTVTATPFPSAQQGGKLVGTGAVGNAGQGASVALSADGNTAIVGGKSDNTGAGAVWIYTRSGGLWLQQGTKLLGNLPVGASEQGYSVAISADGNTAMVGAYKDNNNIGAVWVFIRNGSVWTQQGGKLVGSGGIGFPNQGSSISLSADGNTAAVGGMGDNSGVGAAWIFTRTDGVWTQYGSKLTGTGRVGAPNMGKSVAISADGSTAIVGGYSDNAGAGAVWVFKRVNGIWTQEGSKLVCTGSSGNSYFGYSLAISADGNTVLAGGSQDNFSAGAVWIFTRTSGIWSQQGSKLVGSSGSSTAAQGYSVSLSADGNIAAVGGFNDNGARGALWIYTRSGGIWTQQGNKLQGSGLTGVAQLGTSIALSADGSTALAGGPLDNSNAGAAWVFTVGASISYNGNGSTGGTVPSPTAGPFGTAVTLAGNTGNLVKTGFTFAGWNTLADGTGLAYAAGASYTVSANVTLFAQWLVSPVISSFQPATGCPGTLVTISGSNLNLPSSFTIGGVPAIVVSNNGSSLVGMVMPGAASGPVSIVTAGGSASAAGTFTVTATPYPNVQQGNKLVGSGSVGYPAQGRSVALSADGNTAIVGANYDNGSVGAVWIYTRAAGVWVQQGGKLVGTGAVGNAEQGKSVAISADGNTAIVGGPGDNNGVGAIWVFTRMGGVWSQQGNKLVGGGIEPNFNGCIQGYSVALSADGNTAIVGGLGDNYGKGAAWIFNRNAGIWSQSGPKLIGNGAVNSAQQGFSVAISADGNTAIMGGIQDNSYLGAAWIFVKSGVSWVQQGAKLVGTGAIGSAHQGTSVALSADGNTAMLGAAFDNMIFEGIFEGAAWVFSRTAGVWTQQGGKIVGTGGNISSQGSSVSLSADGNSAIIGGFEDNSSTGASWIVTRANGIWTQQGSKFVGSASIGRSRQGCSVSMSADGQTGIIGGFGDNDFGDYNQKGAAWVITASPAPSISAFSPASGCPGTLVTITGSNLANSTSLSIGGQPAIVVSGSSSKVVAMVMPGALSGAVTMSNGAGTATASGIFTVTETPYPVAQQGDKMVGNGASGFAKQGRSVAVSADGNTAIIGGPEDNNKAGAAWIYVRNGAVWTQQGGKLLGSGAVGAAEQGSSVSLSADGNTAIIGGPGDNGGAGAVWIFNRVNGIWSQQGSKIQGSGAIGASRQGCAVSLSADGNTALWGGSADNNNAGASWVIKRSAGAWIQIGNKLVGNNFTGAAQQGASVALSEDGKTAIVGGNADNVNAGAAWVFIFDGTAFSQQGIKLVGSGAVGAARQGSTVSLSADGNTAMVGGPADNSNAGAAWVFIRTGISWTQQGSKLVGSGASGAAQLGSSVSISADGNTAFVGGNPDNNNAGATWVYTRSGGVWLQRGNKIVGSGGIGFSSQGSSVAMSADGNTALVGGPGDNNNAGAGWVFISSDLPSITSFTPSSGCPGTLVSISGNNFPPTTTLKIGGVPAIVVSNNGNTLLGMVMPGSVTGPISISTSSGTVTSAGDFTVGATPYPATQQGNKLVGTGATGAAQQGVSLSLSADGNTALVGGFADNSNSGSAWIYTRSGNVWSQQGSKLFGTGAIGAAQQGISVSLSADGNTALIGGKGDNGNIGAAWVFIRSGAAWIQQGSKLVGTGAVGASRQGQSVSLSADGNTAVIAGPTDNSNAGAIWVFSRNAGTWTQMGNKLVGSGAVGAAQQGYSVDLSSDGNNIITGGIADNANTGAVWVFVRNGNTWAQQGGKLMGTGAVGAALQGASVSLSADGNTAAFGGTADNVNTGAIWIFARSGVSWLQQGLKLVGSGAVGAAQQGYSVSLSADGNTAVAGGYLDNSSGGAAWVFTRNGTSWTQQGTKISGTGATGTTAGQGVSVSLSSDGNTAMVGGFGDNANAGAAWVFVLPPAPMITSFSPASGCPGTLVRISGTNLSNPSSFRIGGVPAIVISNTGSTLVGMVMPGASSGVVSITTIGGTGISPENFTLTPTPYPSAQQGNKLTGSGNVGAARQGFSVSISADGNTALIGGRTDNSNAGAAWVYIRSGGSWIQQGGKLVGTGAVGAAQQGASVCLSADGNTAIIGGNADNTNAGAVWIFTRSSSGIWSQQGGKLVGTGAVGAAQQGNSVSLSADGNTAIVGGRADNSSAGAVWVFARNGNTWSQQGAKLVGSGAVGAAQQGSVVSLSGDGNTLIVGAAADNANAGAAWVFIRASGVWSQQGIKLVGSGAVGAAQRGTSIAVSADGNTALIGGAADNSNAGATWIFTRSGTTWTQQGLKLVGSGSVGAGQQGRSLALSADGNTALIGGSADNSNAGAVWIFTRSGSTWSQQGSKMVGTGAVGAAQQGISTAISADGSTGMLGGPEDNLGNPGAVWAFTLGCNITYNGNGNTGGTVPIATTGIIGSSVTLSSNSGNLLKTGFSFAGWNTQADGLGTGYAAGSSFTLSGNIILYAQWSSVPSITSFSPASGCPGTLVNISGSNLSGLTSFSIGGVAAIMISNTGTSLVGMVMPGSTNGPISLSTAAGIVNSADDFTVTPTPYPTTQQGNKLVGTSTLGASQQALAVSLSADGNTAIVGGSADNGNAGGAWIFTRSAGTWGQQGIKLFGTGAVGPARQGYSVSLNADGNTALIGAPADNGNIGAVWVFVRNGSSWIQQGSKLIGTGAVGTASQGWSVSLSADGNSALVGGYTDNSNAGGAWMFTRTDGIWTQQGSKLVGSGPTGSAQQGFSVSLSADGKTALVGGPGDNANTGAVWVFSRQGTAWLPQGGKLVGSGAVGAAQQGRSVSINADGNTAMIGGLFDNSNAGAAWIFTRSGGVWSQQGSKLLANAAVGAAVQAYSVSLSADGNTAVLGGPGNNGFAGSSWVFTRNGSSWMQQNSQLFGTGAAGLARQGAGVSLSANGTTAFIGGYSDNSNTGAAWVYAVDNNTITYDGNGNTGGAAPPSITGISGTTITLASNSGLLSKVGYTFSGWNTQADGQGTSYGIGSNYILTGNLTLYAQWTGNTLTVTYDSQGGSAISSGTTATGTSISASPDTPNRAGYTFNGWFVATSGGTAISFPYAHGQTADFTLYAQWTANTLTITYASQGGSAVSNGSTATGASIAVSPGTPTRTGYTFNGWFAESTGGTSISFPFAHGQTADFTLYAQWTANTLTVTYDSQGGSAISNGSTATDDSVAASPGTPTRAGYTFNGWFVAPTGGAPISFPYTHGQAADFTLYAQWTANTLTITYDSQGGSAVSNGSTATDASIAVSPGTPTRTGYTFNGWFAASTGGTAISFPFAHGQTADFTLYAQWSINGYTITFDGNGATGGLMFVQTLAYNATANLMPNGFTRTGFTFVGWATTSTGEVAYTDGASYTMGAANVNLYAKWVAIPTINSFTPLSAPSGAVVVITGTNFTNASAVNFGTDAAASFTVVSSTSIHATLASGASGSVSVTTPGGTASLAGFVYCPVMDTPDVTLSSDSGTAICAGTTVVFTAVANNTGGGTVLYNFKVNGVSVQSGSSDTWTSSTLTNGKTVTCSISIGGGTCLTSTTATSNSLVMAVSAQPTWYLDADNDNHYTGTGITQCYSPGAGYRTSGLLGGNDCDDADNTIWRTGNFYTDADGDNYTVGALQSLCYGASAPTGYSASTLGTDCDDADNTKWRTANRYTDSDGDGFGAGTLQTVCYGLTLPSGYSTNHTDCDDADNSIWRTGNFYTDADGDHYTVGAVQSLCYGATSPTGFSASSLGTDCDDTNPVLTTNCSFYTWTGANSGNWNDPSNWNSNLVPNGAIDVVIPANTTNSISSGGMFSCHSATLQSGVTVGISNGGIWNVSGNLQGATGSIITGAGKVVLNGSSAQNITGTVSLSNLEIGNGPVQIASGSSLVILPTVSNPNALMTLLSGSALTNNGNLILRSNSFGTGSIGPIPANATLIGNITQERLIPSANGWYFVGAPVKSTNLTEWSELNPRITPKLNATFFEYSESDSSIGAANEVNGWKVPNSLATAINPGNEPKGYRIYLGQTNPTRLASVTGQPFTQDVVSPLTFSPGTGYGGGGWNLISNPYPCAINWNQLRNDLANSSLSMSSAYYTFNGAAGNYGTYTSLNAGSGVGVGGLQENIASSQAFFVKASGAANLTFKESFKNTAANSVSFLRTASSELEFLKFKVQQGSKWDEAGILFYPSASEGLDNFDALNLTGSAVDVATVMADGKNSSIEVFPQIGEQRIIPLKVQIPANGTASFHFEGMENFAPSVSFFLKDEFNGTVTNIRQHPEQSFEGITGATYNRFSLIIASDLMTANMDNIPKKRLHLFPNPARSAVAVFSPEAGQLEIYNSMAQKVKTQYMLKGQNILNISGLSNGLYWIKVVGFPDEKLIIE